MTNAVLTGRRGSGFAWLASLAQRLTHAFSIGKGTVGQSGKDASVSVGPETGGAMAGVPAVGELYRKYGASLYWVCLKYVRNKEDAEDMVNQVFLKVQQNIAGFKGQSGIYSWMYRIAVNECIQLFRKRKFEADGAGFPDFEDMLHTSPEVQMDAKILLERITKDADAETVEILFLLYLEGLTQEEVVEKLGISRTTVHRKMVAFKARAERFR